MMLLPHVVTTHRAKARLDHHTHNHMNLNHPVAEGHSGRW